MGGVIAAAAIGYLGLLALRAGLALTYRRRYPKPQNARDFRNVAILQPILSGDPDLEPALEANLTTLADAHFLWLIDDGDITAAAVCDRLRLRHPGAAISVLSLPPAPDGVNPKLFKLQAGQEASPASILVVLDDDTRLPRQSLHALLDALDRCELATGLPCYRQAAGFPSKLLAQFVNDNAVLTYLAPAALMPPLSINGMTYALRRDTLQRIGGFTPLFGHLTDDLAVAKAVQQIGGHICQTPYPQEVATSIRGIASYFRQMHRWYLFGTLLLADAPPQAALLVITFQLLPALLLWTTFVSAAMQHSALAAGAVLSLLMVRGIVLSALNRAVSSQPRHHPVLSVLQELLQPVHLVHALVVRTIRWRTRHYRVYGNARFKSC